MVVKTVSPLASDAVLVSEAMVAATLGEGGVPSRVERTLIRPPRSAIGAIDDATRAALLAASPLLGPMFTTDPEVRALSISEADGATGIVRWGTDGIALCREPRTLRRAMEIGGAYLDRGQQRTTFQPGLLSPELSRRARGFALGLFFGEEFALVLTRRSSDGSHQPIALVEDPGLVKRAIRRAA